MEAHLLQKKHFLRCQSPETSREKPPYSNEMSTNMGFSMADSLIITFHPPQSWISAYNSVNSPQNGKLEDLLFKIHKCGSEYKLCLFLSISRGKIQAKI